MKNFPNQASDVARIRRTLEVASDLNRLGQEVTDDGIFGFALARALAYTFRSLDLSQPDLEQIIETRIEEEQKKPKATQGVRTNAREMRRTLQALAWLDADAALTPEGVEFLESAPGSQSERNLLAVALMNLTITDNAGHTSHPVRTMLDLLAQQPTYHRDGLELALEARDDSEEERNRVRALYSLPQDQRVEELGISPHQLANAKKIFPTLARAAGLVHQDADGLWSLTPAGEIALSSSPDGFARVLTRVRATSRRTYRQVEADDAGRPPLTSIKRALTEAEQDAAGKLLAERTSDHQLLVRRVANMITTTGTFYEDPLSFDLLFVPNATQSALLLFEMKTIRNDAATQTRLACSQLSWYHYFNVSPDWPERAVREIAIFDAPLDSKLTRYLDSEDVSSAWVPYDEDAFIPLTPLAQDLPQLMGIFQ